MNPETTTDQTPAHFPIVLLPRPVADQLQGKAPTRTGGTAQANREETQSSASGGGGRLAVHGLFAGFGLLLATVGLLSGKPGLMILGPLAGAFLLAAGLVPGGKRGGAKPTAQPLRDEHDYAMTDKEWKWEGICSWLQRHAQRPEIFLPSPIRSRAEQQFALLLHRFFPHSILTDRVIELFKKNTAYHPDFIFFESDSGLYIDVEIDEPYSSRGLPTHYRQPDGTAADAERNRYFLDKGWVVLRFAESQIVLYPEECCKFLARLVFQLTGKDEYWKQWSYTQPQLPLVQQWTKEQAEMMCIEHYRASYK